MNNNKKISKWDALQTGWQEGKDIIMPSQTPKP